MSGSDTDLVELAQRAHALEWRAGFAAGRMDTIQSIGARIDLGNPPTMESLSELWSTIKRELEQTEEDRDKAMQALRDALALGGEEETPWS